MGTKLEYYRALERTVKRVTFLIFMLSSLSLKAFSEQVAVESGACKRLHSLVGVKLVGHQVQAHAGTTLAFPNDVSAGKYRYVELESLRVLSRLPEIPEDMRKSEVLLLEAEAAKQFKKSFERRETPSIEIQFAALKSDCSLGVIAITRDVRYNRYVPELQENLFNKVRVLIQPSTGDSRSVTLVPDHPKEHESTSCPAWLFAATHLAPEIRIGFGSVEGQMDLRFHEKIEISNVQTTNFTFKKPLVFERTIHVHRDITPIGKTPVVAHALEEKFRHSLNKNQADFLKDVDYGPLKVFSANPPNKKTFDQGQLQTKLVGRSTGDQQPEDEARRIRLQQQASRFCAPPSQVLSASVATR